MFEDDWELGKCDYTISAWPVRSTRGSESCVKCVKLFVPIALGFTDTYS